MTLITGLITKDAEGRLNVASGGTVVAFNGGTPTDADGNLCVSGLAPPPPPPPPPPTDTFAPFWSQPTGGLLVNGGRGANQNNGGTAMDATTVNALPTTGKWYFEIQVTKATTPSPDAGGISKGKPLANAGNLGAMSRGTGALTFVNVAGGVVSATQATWGGAGTLMFAFDPAAGKLWVGFNNVWFASGNPATDTNPYYSSIPAATYYPAYYADNNGVTGTATLAAGEDTALYDPPTGFSFLSGADPYWEDVVLLMDGQLPLDTNGVASIDKSKYRHSGSAGGGAGQLLTSTAQAYYGGQSPRGDAFASTVFAANLPEFDFGTGDWTIEAIVRMATHQPNGAFYSKRNRNANTNKSFSFFNGASGVPFLQELDGSGATSRSLVSALPIGTFKHISFSKLNNVLYGHFHGVKEYQAANTFAYGNNAEPAAFGSAIQSGANLDGWCHLRVTKGVARYGSLDYTPPGWFPPFGPRPADQAGILGSWGVSALTNNSAGISGTRNEIATQVNGSIEMVAVSQDPLPRTGKWYWEVQCDQASVQLQDIIGVGWDAALVQANTAFGESGHSTIHWITAPTTTIGTAAGTQFSGPVRLGFAYDIGSGLCWVSVNGTYLLSGNPATGANPYFSTIAQSPDPTNKPRRVWARGAADAVISVIKLYVKSSQFSYSVPTGFTALSEAPFLSTLNPYDKSSDMTLSNYFRTVTRTGTTGSYKAAKGTHAINSATTPGYFEVKIDNRDQIAAVVGIAAYNEATNQFPGNTALSWGYADTGQKYYNTIPSAYGNSYTTGDVIGVAYKNGKVWFAKNGVWQNSGDPVTEANPAFTGITGQAIVPMISLYSSSAPANVATLRTTTATCSYALPAGFAYWGAPIPAALLNIDVEPEPQDISTAVYMGGLPYDPVSMNLIVESAAVASYAPGGIGLTASGAVAMDTSGEITSYNAGLPLTATGALAVASAGEVGLLGAFSGGFEGESFA